MARACSSSTTAPTHSTSSAPDEILALPGPATRASRRRGRRHHRIWLRRIEESEFTCCRVLKEPDCPDRVASSVMRKDPAGASRCAGTGGPVARRGMDQGGSAPPALRAPKPLSLIDLVPAVTKAPVEHDIASQFQRALGDTPHCTCSMAAIVLLSFPGSRSARPPELRLLPMTKSGH